MSQNKSQSLVPATKKESGATRGMKDFTSGAVAGVANIVACYPFDTIKVRLQADPGKFKGIMDCMTQTIKQEGVKGLYKGMATPISGIAFINAVVFGAYGQAKIWIAELNHRLNGHLTVGDIVVCGSIAGVANAPVCAPVELIKTRLQTQYSAAGARQYAGPIDCAKQIYKASGYRGLFKGLHATVWREFLGCAAWYGLYEFMRRRMVKEGQSIADLNPFKVMIAGSIGGVGYWTLSYPFDVVKTRMQNQSDLNPKYKSLVDCFKKIIQEEGVAALGRGYTSAVVRAIPAASATFVTFNFMTQLLD